MIEEDTEGNLESCEFYLKMLLNQTLKMMKTEANPKLDPW